MSALTIQSIPSIPLQARPVLNPTTRLRATPTSNVTQAVGILTREFVRRDNNGERVPAAQRLAQTGKLAEQPVLARLSPAHKEALEPLVAAVSEQLARIAKAARVGDIQELRFADDAIEVAIAEHVGGAPVAAIKRALIEAVAESADVPSLAVPGEFAAFQRQTAAIDGYVGTVVQEANLAAARAASRDL